MKKTINWIDHGREPQCAPDPFYPTGIDLDYAAGREPACIVQLPYPAKRCGAHVIECDCGLRVMVTTAGRPDDPRMIKLPCKKGR